MEDYRILLENLSFPSFVQVDGSARCTMSQFGGPRGPTLHSNPVSWSNPRRGRGGGLNPWERQGSQSLWLMARGKTCQYHVLPPFLHEAKKVSSFLEQWRKVINFAKVKYLASYENQKDEHYLLITGGNDICSSNASASKIFLTRSTRQERYYSREKGQIVKVYPRTKRNTKAWWW